QEMSSVEAVGGVPVSVIEPVKFEPLVFFTVRKPVSIRGFDPPIQTLPLVLHTGTVPTPDCVVEVVTPPALLTVNVPATTDEIVNVPLFPPSSILVITMLSPAWRSAPAVKVYV